MHILIADSGSTKTEWVVCRNGKVLQTVNTQGINPYFTDTALISEMLQAELMPVLEYDPDEIYYYGAGCSNAKGVRTVIESLRSLFNKSKIEVSHDMLAAARALCQGEEGIAVILGTGSNCCLFNGKEITQSVISLGYMLGDEGSGAHMGKMFLKDYLYGDMPEDLQDEFLSFIKMNRTEIIDRLYKVQYPSRFLASIAPFINDHKENEYMSDVIFKVFEQHILHQVGKLKGYDTLPIHYTGSIAHYFRKELLLVLESRGLKPGQFMQTPMDGLIRFHSQE